MQSGVRKGSWTPSKRCCSRNRDLPIIRRFLAEGRAPEHLVASGTEWIRSRLVDAMRRVRYCLALLATIIGCESLPGMKVDNPVVGPPPPRVSAPASDEQSEPAQTEPEGPQAG